MLITVMGAHVNSTYYRWRHAISTRPSNYGCELIRVRPHCVYADTIDVIASQTRTIIDRPTNVLFKTGSITYMCIEICMHTRKPLGTHLCNLFYLRILWLALAVMYPISTFRLLLVMRGDDKDEHRSSDDVKQHFSQWVCSFINAKFIPC